MASRDKGGNRTDDHSVEVSNLIIIFIINNKIEIFIYFLNRILY